MFESIYKNLKIHVLYKYIPWDPRASAHLLLSLVPMMAMKKKEF